MNRWRSKHRFRVTNRPRGDRDPLRIDEDRLLAWLTELGADQRRLIRLAARLTQADVAGRVGVTTGLVSRWEREQRGWSRSSGVRYARLLEQTRNVTPESVGGKKSA